MTAAIYRNPHWGYRLSEEDTLWLARGFIGEDGVNVSEKEAGALFWTWMNRYSLLKYSDWWGLAGPRKPFRLMIEYHAQSLSPLWLDPEGEKCQQRPQDCEPRLIARRAKNRSRTWADIRRGAPQVEKFARMAQEGTLPNPLPELTYDFIMCGQGGKRATRMARGAIDIGGNCYYPKKMLSRNDQRLVQAGTVSAEKFVGPFPVPHPENPLTWLLAIPVLMAAGYGIKQIYEAWKKRR